VKVNAIQFLRGCLIFQIQDIAGTIGIVTSVPDIINNKLVYRFYFL
jgi:hypothetical protein